MAELEMFEGEVKRTIEVVRKETEKVDEKIEQLKQAQLMSLQLVLEIQRRVQEIEIQLGGSE